MDDVSHYYPVFPGRTVNPLPVSLSAAGYVSTTSRAYRWDEQNRGPEKRVIWQYTLSGEGALRISGEELRIPPEHAMLLTIPEAHCYYLPEQPGIWEFCYLVLEGETAVRMAESLRNQYSSVLPFLSGGECVKSAKLLLEHARERQFRSPWQIAEEVFAFLCRMSRELEQAHAGGKNEPPFLKRIFSLLQKNPDATPQEMAAAAGYSRLYLDRILKQYTGETPAHYLRSQKLRRAAGLLINTPLNVKQIAAECGFYDTAYFCRTFQKTFGKTPSQYRKMQ